MALEHLLGALERAAAAQAAVLTADAGAQAAAVTAESDARVSRRREDALTARRAALVSAMEVTLAGRRRAARQAGLDARTRLLERVFDAARGLFPAVVGEARYRDALPAQLAAALAAVGDEPAVVTGAKALIPQLRAALPRDSRAEVRAEAGVGSGFRVSAADGVMEVDATLEGRLERLRPALAIALIRGLGESA
jgi:vacuolar-type H+-ATPase subunit E/Vma4